MALILADRTQQTGTANTTVSFTLSGSVTGFQSFAIIGNGNTTYYSATDASGNWEVGIGTYSTTGPTLARTTILSSSNYGAAVTFSGTVNVFITYPAEAATITGANGGVQYNDNGILTGSSSFTFDSNTNTVSTPSLSTGYLRTNYDANIGGITVGYGNNYYFENTAVGYYALASDGNTGNTAFGSEALRYSTDGYDNSAFGTVALKNNVDGYVNSAFGNAALFSNISGFQNSAFGSAALNSCTGNNNTANGVSAGSNVTTGTNNVLLGYLAGTDAVFNATTASNRIVIGNNSSTNAYIKIAWTVTSDARDKTNVAPVSKGLDFVSKLNPVSYQFTDNRTDKNPTGDVKYGFLAQDILALEGDSPVIIDNKDEENLKYNGESLVPILVKAIQELNAKVEALEAQLGK